MQDAWYLVPTSGAGTLTDPNQPKYADRFDSFSSYHLPTDNAFLVRYYGDTADHDATRGESDVTEISLEEVTTRLNDALDVEYTPAQWENKLYA